MNTRGAVVVSWLLFSTLVGSPHALAGPAIAAPTDLVASGAFASASMDASVLLSWTDNSDNDAGFLVQVSEDAGLTWTSVAYTPSDYITLHRSSGASTIGYYPGLTPGSTRIFRVAGTHPTLGLSDFSKEVAVDMPKAATCSDPWELQPVQDFKAHVGFPIDLRVVINRPPSCYAGNQYCLQDGPTGMGIDFNGGLVSWTPDAVFGWGGWVPVTLGWGTGDNLHHCTSTVATSSFWIKVDDNTLTLPLFRDYRSEATTIPVQGRAYQNFASYALYSSPLCSSYAGGNCPNSVISLPSTTPVSTTGLLANWDNTSLPNGSRRLVSFIVQAPTFENSAIYDPVILDRTAWNTSWPKRLPLGSVRGALAVDLNGDGVDEILAGARDPSQGGPYAWNLDGTLRWQAPAPGSLTAADPAAGDITGDGNYEVVTTTISALRVLNGSTGALLASVAASSFGSGYQFQSGASLADISGDGILDILVNVSGMTGSPAPVGKTLAYRWNGTGLVAVTGWPQTLTASKAMSPPSTADLDGNGSLEVIVDNDTKLYAWNPNGTLFGIFPVNLPIPPTASTVNGGTVGFGFSQPAIADLDGNGTLEIVVGQNVFASNGAYLRCLRATTCTAITGAVGLSPAIGQFDLSTPGPEILLGGNVFSGTTGLRTRTLGLGAGAYGPAALVDGGLNSQGTPETYAVMGTMGQNQFNANITAFDGNGTIEEDYPKALYGNTASGSAPQGGDFDGDGNEDVLVEITDSTYGAVVALYKAPGETPFNAANNPWPMHGHDAQRTGRYSCKQQRQACTSNSQCCSNSCSTTCR